MAVANHSVPVFIANHLIGEVEGDQGNGKTFNRNFGPYNDTIMTLARELDAYLIDLPKKMREKAIALEEFVSVDQIHLAIDANQHYAEMVFAGLNEISLK